MAETPARLVPGKTAPSNAAVGAGSNGQQQAAASTVDTLGRPATRPSAVKALVTLVTLFVGATFAMRALASQFPSLPPFVADLPVTVVLVCPCSPTPPRDPGLVLLPPDTYAYSTQKPRPLTKLFTELTQLFASLLSPALFNSPLWRCCREYASKLKIPSSLDDAKGLAEVATLLSEEHSLAVAIAFAACYT